MSKPYKKSFNSKDGKSIYHYRETVYVSCETGYHMKGDSSMTCEHSGQWYPTLPTCEGKHSVK